MLHYCPYCHPSTAGRHETHCPNSFKTMAAKGETTVHVNQVVACSKCPRLEEDNKQLREALRQIRDMNNRIYNGVTADGEGSSHVIVAPDYRKMQRIAEEALEGGGSDD